MSSELSAAISSIIEGKLEDQRRFLDALACVPPGNPPGNCAAHGEETAVLLEKLGLKVERHPISEDLARANGIVSATNLIVRERFGAGPAIALNAHCEISAPSIGPSSHAPGNKDRDGEMNGRFEIVATPDIATYVFALLALKEAAAKAQGHLAGAVELHVTYDNEAGGSMGPALLLNELLTRPHYAISTGSAGNIVVAHTGSLHLEITLSRKPSGGIPPQTGTGGVGDATRSMLTALYAERDRLAGLSSETAGIGSPRLAAGSIASVADPRALQHRVSLQLDRQVIPDEDPAGAEAGLKAIILNATARYSDVTCQVKRTLLALPLVPMPGQGRLVWALQKHAKRILGDETGVGGVANCTSARHYAAAGVPVVLYGVGLRMPAHVSGRKVSDEFQFGPMLQTTEIVALALADLLAQR